MIVNVMTTWDINSRQPYTDMKLKYIIPAILVLASCGHKSDGDRQPLMTVDVARPVTDSVIVYYSYPGILDADRTVDLVARVNGVLLSETYTSGDIVEAGQVLFNIEPDNYRDAVNSAQAALDNARSAYAYASQHYAALEQAYRSDAVSRMEMEQGRSAMEQSRAQIESASAQLATARTRLGYCAIRAPFKGKVTMSTVSDGAYISGEGEPYRLATIYDDAVMRANFAIEDVGYISGLRSNMEHNAIDYNHIPLEFTNTLPHKYFGRMHYVAPDVNTSTGTMSMQLKIDNPYGELKPGMYVSIKLPVASDPHAILVKDAAISTDQRGDYIYVVNDSNKVVYTPVVAGETYRDSLRIVTGVDPSARYVTKALLRVRNGMEVNPRIVR